MFLHNSFFTSLAIWFVALIAASVAPAQAAHPEMVVSTEWLAQHLNDPRVVVLHVGSKPDYDAGHIRGARLLTAEDFIDGQSPLETELRSPEQLKDAFEKLGVSDDTRIVLYTTGWYPAAGRAYYTLDFIGHGNHTSLLDGSIQRWRSENRPVSKEPSPAATRGSLTLHVHPEVRELLEAVKKSSQSDGNTVLVDSRPDKRYRDGHISGASHVFWEETVVNGTKDPTLLPPDKLRTLFAARGIKPGQKLITYCEVGLQASHTYFIAKYLGYDASMFDGSIHQWSHVEMLPLVPGETPRCPGGGNACETHEKMMQMMK
ncbi:MAG TPA: rhodanese-like domain-containing protein [Verrucomicrobiae bacterium]|jgi:thiosulfate/3-mercaptopyruvate sulfurtransferase|nr:rhodanese-like domain-containing protein [Verrucomicrobiae bacterium]